VFARRGWWDYADWLSHLPAQAKAIYLRMEGLGRGPEKLLGKVEFCESYTPLRPLSGPVGQVLQRFGPFSERGAAGFTRRRAVETFYTLSKSGV